MRRSDVHHLIELLSLAERGVLTRSDARSLFMIMRAVAPGGTALQEIGHTLAHDERDRGFTHKHLNAFVEQLIRHLVDARNALPVATLFDVHQVVGEVASACDALGIQVNVIALHAHADRLAAVTAAVLDGSQVRLNRPGLTLTFVDRVSDEGPQVLLSVHEGLTINGREILSPYVALAFPLLRHIPGTSVGGKP